MLKNEDIKLLIKIEHFIGCNMDKLLGEVGVWDGSGDLGSLYEGDDTWTFSRDDFEKLYDLIDRVKLAKKKASDKTNAWNKAHKERHCEINKQSYKRVKQLKDKKEK